LLRGRYYLLENVFTGLTVRAVS